MAEYIDRDAAIAACLDGYADCRDDCAANIRNLPAADVVERKTVKWEVDEVGCGICSACGNLPLKRQLIIFLDGIQDSARIAEQR